ncbi:unnamed protein product [Mytilus coruscus]|uniref:ISXO2-like transposase domain-containing protein n=1 Tax=Mytilus coruscus TaxID=42192 RepID=A0A6J8A3F8_MYTCO|nr:unnamed protein product [Mytilus coruscus]
MQDANGPTSSTSDGCGGAILIRDVQKGALLEQFVLAHSLKSSVVYSDQWRAYNKIQDDLNLEHAVVNHCLHFVDPDTGIHTQIIESYWAKAKYKLKEMIGVSSDALPSYLVDKRMWRERWGKTGEKTKNIGIKFNTSIVNNFVNGKYIQVAFWCLS